MPHSPSLPRLGFLTLALSLLVSLVPVFVVATPAQAQTASTLVINEIDYDQPSTDTAEFLEIKKGLLEGLALEAWGFVAELEGRLDCNTLEFEANATSGIYGLGLPVGVPMGTFGGTLTGKLNPMTRQLEGDWKLVDDFGVQGCNGPWTASHTP